MSPPHKGVLHAHDALLDFAARLFDSALLLLASALVLYPFDRHSQLALISYLMAVALGFQLMAALTGCYRSWRTEKWRHEQLRLLMAIILTFTLVAIFALLTPLYDLSAEVLLRIAFLSILFLLGSRLALRWALSWLRRNGQNTRTAIVLGGGDLGCMLVQRIQMNPWMGIRLRAIYDDNARCKAAKGYQSFFQGNIQQGLAAAKEDEVHQVFIALPMRDEKTIREIVDALSDTTATVYFVPNVFLFDLMHARHLSVEGMPVISIFDTPFTLSNAASKRLFDILFSAVALIFLLIPMLLIAAAVRYTSPGPAIFKQKRYGVDGKPIEVWKFRTMRVMENASTVTQATRDDPRVTTIGKVLRSTSLDELPQFINVLRGDMSVVGPRPHAVAHNEQYRKLIKGYMLRHKVKPGITGWAQVNGWRGETDTLDKMQKRIDYDLEYIRHWSLWLDVKIVFMTIFKGFSGKNAY